MNAEYIVAYDQGTSGVKAALVAMDGSLLGCASGAYPLYEPLPGYAEQDPEDYWTAICDATSKVLKKTKADVSKARGVVFGAIWKSIIPVDRDIRPLRRSIIWLDSRAKEEAAEINRKMRVNTYVPRDYWAKLLWFCRNEPEIYDAAYKIIGVNSYFGWKATGNLVTNISDSFVYAHNASQQNLYDRILEGTGITKDKFADWVSSSTEIGKLTAAAAEELGLKAGIPVFAGSGDIQAITIGAGGSIPGKVHAYFGSSGWMGALTEFGEPRAKISPLNQTYNVEIGAMRIGLVLNWMIDQVYHQEKRTMGDEIFEYINCAIADIPAGSDGLLSVPFLFGGSGGADYLHERASFFNVNASHDRRHMLRAVMEGVCLSMRMTNLPQLEKMDPKVSDSICVVGGGACSDPWMQMLADVLNLPVEVPYHPRHIGTVGVAYHALIGLGEFEGYEQAAANVKAEKVFHPRDAAVHVYQDAYEQLVNLRAALRPIYERR